MYRVRIGYVLPVDVVRLLKVGMCSTFMKDVPQECRTHGIYDIALPTDSPQFTEIEGWLAATSDFTHAEISTDNLQNGYRQTNSQLETS